MNQGDNTGKILLKTDISNWKLTIIFLLTANYYTGLRKLIIYKFCKKKIIDLITILIVIIYIYSVYHYIKALQIKLKEWYCELRRLHLP